MASGIDAAREAGAVEHAALMSEMKEQLIIVLMKRLVDKDGWLRIPIEEVDGTGGDLLSFSVDFDSRIFEFHLSKKQ